MWPLSLQCVWVQSYIYFSACMHVCKHVYVCICVYVCMYVCMYECKYVCMNVCMYVRICKYLYTVCIYNNLIRSPYWERPINVASALHLHLWRFLETKVISLQQHRCTVITEFSTTKTRRLFTLFTNIRPCTVLWTSLARNILILYFLNINLLLSFHLFLCIQRNSVPSYLPLRNA